MSTYLGQYLKSQREKAAFSQVALGRRYKFKSSQFVSNWERGLCKPPLRILKLMMRDLTLDHESLRLAMQMDAANEIEELLRGIRSGRTKSKK